MTPPIKDMGASPNMGTSPDFINTIYKVINANKKQKPNDGDEQVQILVRGGGIFSVSDVVMAAMFDQDSHQLFRLIDLDQNGNLSFSEVKR